MLTTAQKATILRQSGLAIPDSPAAPIGDPAGRLPGTGSKLRAAATSSDLHSAWSMAIDNLFVGYVAARAAKSLRDAEEARMLGTLRKMATTTSSSYSTRWPQWA